MLHILPKVRIQRKAKSAARKSQDWTKLFLSLTQFQINLFGWGGKSEIERSRVQLNDARAEKIRIEQELTRLRIADMGNKIVLGDLKIEEYRKSLEAKNVIPSSTPSDIHY